MQNFYLVRWLREKSGLDPEIIDSLKYELDKRIYYYGGQFATPYEKTDGGRRLAALKTSVREIVLSFKSKGRTSPAGSAGTRVSSNAYFSFNKALKELGFGVSDAPWRLGRRELGDDELYFRIRRMIARLENDDFSLLVRPEFAAEIHALEAALKKYYSKAGFSALVVPFDLPFFERLAIKIFRELGLPSFVSLHGLPGRYNAIDDNRADYLLVWGDRIKDSYARAGVPPEKIFVTGHPGYRKPAAGAPRFSLDDVLVLSKAVPGAQNTAEQILSDRGNSILYLCSLRKALEKAGVRRARLRLHPSESAAWYERFLGGDFFVPDNAPLTASLARASLTIGPTSTVFLESLLAGVNYLVYEPAAGGLDLLNYPLVPPFDGSDPAVPAAADEEALGALLASGRRADPAVLAGYIRTPFDLSFLPALLSRKRPGR